MEKEIAPHVFLIREHTNPKVSLIIPSYDGYRNGNVPKMIQKILDSGFESLEILIVKAVSPNGRARDEGVKAAKGNYFVFMDDDVCPGSENIISALIDPFEQDHSIGMTGASYLLPPDAPKFQKQVAQQMERVECPVSPIRIESDMVCHACLAVPAKIYHETGGEHRDLISGTDPDFKARIRNRNYRIVIVPNTWVYMPTFETWKELCKKSYQGGKNSLRMQRWFPELVQPSGIKLEQPVAPKKSSILRILQRIKRILLDLIRFRWLSLTNQCLYSAGYFVEWLTGRKKKPN